jgi:CheY-like chemotaxis protein
MFLIGKHIFIVEDNAQNRVVFKMALIRHGASVDFERWGRDSVYQLRQAAQVDLIILDLMLAEGISGFDLFEEIRLLPAYVNTPIIAVSAMDAALAIPKARDLGFAGFIAKPIDNHLFPQQVARIIRGEQLWYTGQDSPT